MDGSVSSQYKQTTPLNFFLFFVHFKHLLVCIPMFLFHTLNLCYQMKLFDHRLLQKGSVQSYQGNVNSHTRIQIAVDPTEKVIMSGE